MLAVIYPCSYPLKSSLPCLAHMLKSSLIITDMSFTPRLYDPFQLAPFLGHTWKHGICRPCPFCSQCCIQKAGHKAPLARGCNAYLLSSHLSVSPPHPIPLLYPKQWNLCQSEGACLSSNPLLSLILAMFRALNIPLRALGF